MTSPPYLLLRDNNYDKFTGLQVFSLKDGSVTKKNDRCPLVYFLISENRNFEEKDAI
jgi:hypothetical protein